CGRVRPQFLLVISVAGGGLGQALGVVHEISQLLVQPVLLARQGRTVDPLGLVEQAAALPEGFEVRMQAELDSLEHGRQTRAVQRMAVQNLSEFLEIGNSRMVGGGHRANLRFAANVAAAGKYQIWCPRLLKWRRRPADATLATTVANRQWAAVHPSVAAARAGRKPAQRPRPFHGAPAEVPP